MSDHRPATDDDLPALGRLLTWVDRPGSGTKLFRALGLLCALLLVIDLLIHKHGHFHIEDVWAFYGVYGFVSFVCVIYGAKTLRFFAKRDEDYYGTQAIDSEDYPRDQTGVTKEADDA